jgi:hypothetical protein
MVNNRTILYYSSNRESPEFEDKIIKQLKAVAGDIPIISVTQNPMDLGRNICVGDRGNSYLNEYRQILIGCMAAETDFVYTVEADCLYPQGYFDFEPTKLDTIYKCDNHWILFAGKPYFWHKDHSQASLIFGRQLLIDMINKALVGLPEWSPKKEKFCMYDYKEKWEYFHSKYPVINIKTGNGVNKGTVIDKDVKPRLSVDYWGHYLKLKAELLAIYGI